MTYIPLGYEVGSRAQVSIPLKHTVVVGQTEHGKTTAIEAVVKRGGMKVIIFRTKRGEHPFKGAANRLQPFYRERSDWRYVSALLEALLKEKMRFERAWIMRACEGTRNLREVHLKIQGFLANEKTRGLDRNVYTMLDNYFREVIPQLEETTFSNRLELVGGLNLMDLEPISPEVQQLVIRSTIECVFAEHSGVVVVIPEAQDFIPEGRNTPVKLIAAELIRKGASVQNRLWIDAQTITGVDKAILKQCQVWLLGKQGEKNEVERTRDQLPLPRRARPGPEEVMTLPTGVFYVVADAKVRKTYVQPAWMEDDEARRRCWVLDTNIPEKTRPMKAREPLSHFDHPTPEEVAQVGNIRTQTIAQVLAQEPGHMRVRRRAAQPDAPPPPSSASPEPQEGVDRIKIEVNTLHQQLAAKDREIKSLREALDAVKPLQDHLRRFLGEDLVKKVKADGMGAGVNKDLLETWLSNLSKSGASKPLRILAEHHPMRPTMAQFRTLCGLRATGTWRTYMAILRRNNLIDESGDGIALAAMFLEG